MPPRKPMVPETRFDRLMVIGPADPYLWNGIRFPRVLCSCDCGNEVTVRESALRSGNTKSCGCLHREVAAETCLSRVAHGLKGIPEYRTWGHIIQRCTNPNNKAWHHYGGRGIRVCDRWRNSIDAFLEDMGRRPGPEYSIDRIDNDGNYEPGNCRWATKKVQQRNKRDNRLITCRGRTQCLGAWAEEAGIRWHTLRERLRRGWTVERAITAPVRRR